MRLGIRVISSGFLRKAFVLTSGTAIAQLISILTIPILSRIYLPEYYGILGLYAMVTTILGTIATFQYQNAVILAKEEYEARQAVSLCIATSFIVAALSLLIFLFLNTQIAMILKSEEFAGWLMVTPVSIFFNGINAGLAAWANRQAKYKLLTTNRILAAILIPVVSIPLGKSISGPFGLVAATLVSNILPAFILGYHFFFRNQLRLVLDKKILISCGKKYIQLPRYSLPAEFINNFINNIPVIMLGRYFGTASVGHFNMSNRVLGMPIQLLSSSFAEVFRQRASKEYNEKGECAIFFLKTFYTLAALSILPFLILFFFGPQLFGFFFGEKWIDAGFFSGIMAPLFFLRFTISPLSYMFYIAGKQREDFIIHIVMLILISLSFLVTIYFRGSIAAALTSFTIVYSLVYFYYLFRSFKFSKGKLP